MPKKFKRVSFTKDFRRKIFERDNYECQICLSNLINKPSERVIDHKTPLSKGGDNSLGNLWLLCDSCDKRKKNHIKHDLATEYKKLHYLKGKGKGYDKNQGSGNIFRDTNNSKD